VSDLKDEITELEINVKALLKELDRVKFQYQRLLSAAGEHADECDAAGTLRWTIRMLISEEPV
jgi:hypothetical protein